MLAQNQQLHRHISGVARTHPHLISALRSDPEMKFNATLLSLALPEWAIYFIAYKHLKILLIAVRKGQRPPADFWAALDDELCKVARFYAMKCAWAEAQMAKLSDALAGVEGGAPFTPRKPRGSPASSPLAGLAAAYFSNGGMLHHTAGGCIVGGGTLNSYPAITAARGVNIVVVHGEAAASEPTSAFNTSTAASSGVSAVASGTDGAAATASSETYALAATAPAGIAGQSLMLRPVPSYRNLLGEWVVLRDDATSSRASSSRTPSAVQNGGYSRVSDDTPVTTASAAAALPGSAATSATPLVRSHIADAVAADVASVDVHTQFYVADVDVDYEEELRAAGQAAEVGVNRVAGADVSTHAVAETTPSVFARREGDVLLPAAPSGTPTATAPYSSTISAAAPSSSGSSIQRQPLQAQQHPQPSPRQRQRGQSESAASALRALCPYPELTGGSGGGGAGGPAIGGVGMGMFPRVQLMRLAPVTAGVSLTTAGDAGAASSSTSLSLMPSVTGAAGGAFVVGGGGGGGGGSDTGGGGGGNSIGRGGGLVSRAIHFTEVGVRAADTTVSPTTIPAAGPSFAAAVAPTGRSVFAAATVAPSGNSSSDASAPSAAGVAPESALTGDSASPYSPSGAPLIETTTIDFGGGGAGNLTTSSAVVSASGSVPTPTPVVDDVSGTGGSSGGGGGLLYSGTGRGGGAKLLRRVASATTAFSSSSSTSLSGVSPRSCLGLPPLSPRRPLLLSQSPSPPRQHQQQLQHLAQQPSQDALLSVPTAHAVPLSSLTSSSAGAAVPLNLSVVCTTTDTSTSSAAAVHPLLTTPPRRSATSDGGKSNAPSGIAVANSATVPPTQRLATAQNLPIPAGPFVPPPAASADMHFTVSATAGGTSNQLPSPPSAVVFASGGSHRSELSAASSLDEEDEDDDAAEWGGAVTGGGLIRSVMSGSKGGPTAGRARLPVLPSALRTPPFSRSAAARAAAAAPSSPSHSCVTALSAPQRRDTAAATATAKTSAMMSRGAISAAGTTAPASSTRQGIAAAGTPSVAAAQSTAGMDNDTTLYVGQVTSTAADSSGNTIDHDPYSMSLAMVSAPLPLQTRSGGGDGKADEHIYFDDLENALNDDAEGEGEEAEDLELEAEEAALSALLRTELLQAPRTPIASASASRSSSRRDYLAGWVGVVPTAVYYWRGMGTAAVGCSRRLDATATLAASATPPMPQLMTLCALQRGRALLMLRRSGGQWDS